MASSKIQKSVSRLGLSNVQISNRYMSILISPSGCGFSVCLFSFPFTLQPSPLLGSNHKMLIALKLGKESFCESTSSSHHKLDPFQLAFEIQMPIGTIYCKETSWNSLQLLLTHKTDSYGYNAPTFTGSLIL